MQATTNSAHLSSGFPDVPTWFPPDMVGQGQGIHPS